MDKYFRLKTPNGQREIVLQVLNEVNYTSDVQTAKENVVAFLGTHDNGHLWLSNISLLTEDHDEMAKLNTFFIASTPPKHPKITKNKMHSILDRIFVDEHKYFIYNQQKFLENIHHQERIHDMDLSIANMNRIMDIEAGRHELDVVDMNRGRDDAGAQVLSIINGNKDSFLVKIIRGLVKLSTCYRNHVNKWFSAICNYEREVIHPNDLPYEKMDKIFRNTISHDRVDYFIAMIEDQQWNNKDIMIIADRYLTGPLLHHLKEKGYILQS